LLPAIIFHGIFVAQFILRNEGHSSTFCSLLSNCWYRIIN